MVTRPNRQASPVQSRQEQHVASRLCAARVLLEAGAADTAVGRTYDGRPAWPHGFVGSLTHTTTFVAAAAAPAVAQRSIGLDSERIVGEQESSAIAGVCCSRRELRSLEAWPFDRCSALTLLFSSKEALFKCVHPIGREFFDFVDAEVAGVDAARRTIRILLCRSLGRDFAYGDVFEGRYAFAFGHVHTCFELPADVGHAGAR
jgi:enterobactin synthetase component D